MSIIAIDVNEQSMESTSSYCTIAAWMCALLLMVAVLAGCSQPTGGTDAPAGDAGTMRCGALTCRSGEICAYLCDCCGVPTFDGGPQPSSHEVCVPDTGQCGSGTITVEGRPCTCDRSAREAHCLCA
jgi:hypothetical protein